MLEITRDVWQGTDYFPFVWHRWLHDSTGRLFTAVLDGDVVGFQHIALHSPGTAWLEGIRTAEHVRRRGVGGALLRHGIEWGQDQGCRIAALSTSSTNASSTRLADKCGLRQVGEFTSLAASTDPSAGNADVPIRVAHVSQAEEIALFLGIDAASDDVHQYYSEGWTAYRLNTERLRLLLATHALVLAGRHEIEGIAAVTWTVQRPRLRLGLLRGSREATRALAVAVRRVAHRNGVKEVVATVVLDGETAEGIRLGGFSAHRDFSMVLHELRL